MSSPMKIAFITFQYPPFIQGGAGTYANNLTKELASLGHKVHVITPRVAGCVKEEATDGLFIHRIGFINKPFLSAPSFWLSLWQQFSVLERQVNGFNIVHDNGLSAFSLSKRAVSCPRVVTVHHLARTSLNALETSLISRMKNMRTETGISPIIELPCMKRADRIIAVSQGTKQDIVRSYDLSESDIEVIYHGVRSDDFVFTQEEINKLRESIGIDQEPMILFVGRLESRKGIDVLLKALRLILDRIDTKLVLAGSGNQGDYRELVQSLDIADKTVFMGRVPDETLRLLYASCDLFVLPSRLEGLGIVLLEAMAAGKPIVATRVGGIPEIVESGENGILVDVNNEEELTQAITRFLSDSTYAKSTGENNASTARSQYNWRDAALRTEQLYELVLNQT